MNASRRACCALVVLLSLITQSCGGIGATQAPVMPPVPGGATFTSSPPEANTPPPTPLPYASLQIDNDLPLILLSPRTSPQLADNGIGVHYEDYERYGDTGLVVQNGYKWVRILCLTDFWAPNRLEPATFELDSIPQYADDALAEYAAFGVNVVLTLWLGAGLAPYATTFQSPEEIDRFSENVRLVVSHYKGRIPYYEIWNEPGAVAVSDYANLVRAVVPIIREQDPQARIIIGAVPGDWEDGHPNYGAYQRFSVSMHYLDELLRSGVAPMVDGISWHPFYDNIPNDAYYQDYPQTLKGIQELAASQGFTGEYFADELLWRTVSEEGWAGGPPVSAAVAAKYYSRAITLHRAFGVHVTMNTFFLQPENGWAPEGSLAPLQHLNNVLAGAAPAELPVSVQSEAANISTYAFSLPDGSQLIAVWTNDQAVEEDPGVNAALAITASSPGPVSAIDVLHGFEQQLVAAREGDHLVIRGFLLKDYPIFIRLER